MTWLGAAVGAVVVAAVAPRMLPRVAIKRSTKTVWALPLAAILGAGVGLLDLHPILAAALTVVAGLAAVMVVVDLYEHRLPDTLILASLTAWLMGAVVSSAMTGEWDALVRSLFAGLAVFAGFFVLGLLANGMLGFGDVKLSALLGAVLGWFGWAAVGRGLLLGILAHGLAALVVLAVTRDRKADVAMGPALIAGAAVALAVS